MSICWVRHPMAKDVERRWSTIIACVVKLRNLSFVVAMSALNMKARIPCLFRTYKAPEFQSPNCTIWEAARATATTPMFFDRIVINGEPFVDGGMGRPHSTGAPRSTTHLPSSIYRLHH